MIVERSATKDFLNKIRPYSGEIFIFSFFLLLSFLLTYPLFFRMRSSLYWGDLGLGHFSNDAKGSIYLLWWLKYALCHHLPWKFISFQASPFGNNLIQLPLQPGLQYPSFVLALLVDEVFAHNFLLFLGFPLSAITMYYLAYYFSKSKPASMISGIIYGFCSYHVFHGYCHLGLAMLQWMPLYILFLFKFADERNHQSAIGVALSLTLVTLTAYYYGYLMLVFTAAFLLFKVAYEWIKKRGSGLDYRTLRLSVFIVSVALFLIISFLSNVFIFENPRFVPQTEAAILFNLEFFAARWWSYLVPSFENLIFGHYVKDFLYSQMSGNPAEQILYLGYVPLALAVLALFGRRKRGEKTANCGEEGSPVDKRMGFALPFFTFVAFVALIWSSPLYVSLGNFKIPMPSSFVYGILPVFRQYGRFGVLAILSVSVLAGIGLKQLLQNFASLRSRYLVATLMSLLVLVEFINVPPSRTVNVGANGIPSVYRWLTSQSGDFSIAEYPFLAGSDPRGLDYVFHQRVHQKRMINGAPEYHPAARAISYLGNVADPEVPLILSYLGVKYVIVHTDLYRSNEGTIPRIPSGQALQYGTAGQGLVFVKSFPGALVYEVEARPQKILWLRYKNFYPFEVWEDGKEWSWASSDEAEVVAVNYTGRELPCDIHFFAASLGKPCNIKILLNGKEVKKVTVASAPEVTEVILKDVRLQSGENSIMLYTDLPAEKIDTYPAIGGATFAVSDFGIKH